MKSIFIVVLLITFTSCNTEQKKPDYGESDHQREYPQEQNNYTNSNFTTKAYTAADYEYYDNIVYHSATSINTNPTSNQEFSNDVNNALEEIKKKGSLNPEFKQWFFIECKFNFGYNSGKQKMMYSDLLECGQYACDGESLIMLKDQFVSSNLLQGQSPIDYRIHVINGYYSYASDLRQEVMKKSNI